MHRELNPNASQVGIEHTVHEMHPPTIEIAFGTQFQFKINRQLTCERISKWWNISRKLL